MGEGQDWQVSRRRFLQLVSGGVAAGAVGLLASDRIFEIVGWTPTDSRALAGQRKQWVMLIDLARCNGCGECTKCSRLHPFVHSPHPLHRARSMSMTHCLR